MRRNPYAKTDDTIRKIMHAAFPEFAGKQVQITPHSGRINLTSYWDEGSKKEFAFVRLPDFKSAPIPTQSPYDPAIPGLKDYQMIPGVLVVEWSYLRGKRTTPIIHTHPDNFNQVALPAPAVELTFVQALALLVSRMYKGGYRLDEFNRFVGLGKAAFEKARAELVAMGLLTANNALTVEGKNAASQWRDEYALAEKYGIKKRAFNPVKRDSLYVGDRVGWVGRKGIWGVVIGFGGHRKQSVQVMWSNGRYRTMTADKVWKMPRR